MAKLMDIILLMVWGFSISATSRPMFSGDFEITDLVVDSPFQRDPTSTANSTITFKVSDQDRPKVVNCHVEWPVSVQPPSDSSKQFCEDSKWRISFPQGTYKGTGNLMISLSHSYEDNSVGNAPYNWLTKLADLNLTYPSTADYGCDLEKARCESRKGTKIIADVSRAIAK